MPLAESRNYVKETSSLESGRGLTWQGMSSSGSACLCQTGDGCSPDLELGLSGVPWVCLSLRGELCHQYFPIRKQQPQHRGRTALLTCSQPAPMTSSERHPDAAAPEDQAMQAQPFLLTTPSRTRAASPEQGWDSELLLHLLYGRCLVLNT